MQYFGFITDDYDLVNKKYVDNSIPSITLNGSTTTSAAFFAPTTAGTSGYYLQSSGNGAPTWVASSGGNYTATSPIDITNDVISHEISGVTAGTYDGGYVKLAGYYIPSFQVDARGHITSATDLGSLIPGTNTTYAHSETYNLIYGYHYYHLVKTASDAGNSYILTAGTTTRSFQISDSAPLNSSAASYLRINAVEAVDANGEAVGIDWSVDYPSTTAGKVSYVTLTVTIAEPYSQNIFIFPTISYSTSLM